VLAERLRSSRRPNARPGRARPPDRPAPPPTLFRLGATLLWDDLAGLVALNLAGTIVVAPLVALGLTLGFVPTVVAGAALFPVAGGLLGAVVGELRGEPGGLGRRAIATVRARWRPLLVLGLFTNGVVAGCLVTTARVLGDGSTAGGDVIAFWLAQSAFLVLLVVLLVYALPLIACYGTGVRAALRNALILATAAPLQTLGMVALLVVLAVLTLWVGLGMWLIVPVVAAVFLGVNCWLQVERLRGGLAAPERA
jgi:hypothetical protein